MQSRGRFKKFSSPIFASVVLSGSLLLAAPSFAQDQATQPDNSAQNKQQQTTAQQQSGAASDRHLTAEIRKSLIADKSLSTYAHNIKIITVNGAVTLKGPVKSDSEKQSVLAKAVAVAGADKV